MKTELIQKFNFTASHSLADHEAPHPHLWTLEVTLTGKPIKGKIVDMVLLQQTFGEKVDPLHSSYLNENQSLGHEAMQLPTCEMLAAHFFTEFKKVILNKFIPENLSIQLVSVSVALSDTKGTELGAARVHAL